MKSLKKRWVLPIAALLVAVGGYAMAARRGRGEADAAHYVTARVQRSDVVSYVSATGVIQPWKVVDVKSDIGGRIEKMAVDLGDHVKSGQLIALIDPTDARAAAEQAGADLTAAVAKRDGAAADAASQAATTQAHVAAAEQALQEARVKEAEAAASMRAQPKLTAAAIQQGQAGLAAAHQALAQARQSERQLVRERWSTIRFCCWPMSRPARSIPAPARRSWRSSSACTGKERPW